MNDRVLLVLSALASSLAAWAFWHYLDRDAIDVLVLVALIGAIADNRRLRRALRQSAAGDGKR
ncbi:hypothetical protein [Massilia sp. METH4]|uniref:hypothetical protein n=1 Tax=Massilia sp. METH4 TaxID=3123041 RepID=UPI0030CE9D62